MNYQALRNIRLQQEAASSNDNQTAANSNKFTQSLLVNIMRSICLRQAIDEDVHRVVVKKNKKGEGKSAVSLLKNRQVSFITTISVPFMHCSSMSKPRSARINAIVP